METRINVVRVSKRGKEYVAEVDLDWKPRFIDFLGGDFGFNPFSINDVIKKGGFNLGVSKRDSDRPMLYSRLNTLRKSGWTSYDRKSKLYKLHESKFERYIRKFGSLHTGPLSRTWKEEMKKKQADKEPEKVIEKYHHGERIIGGGEV